MTNYEYSPVNKLIELRSEELEVRSYEYDANGNTTKINSQTPSEQSEQLQNSTTEFTYDNKNQLVKAVKPNADTIEYTYDGNGNRYSKSVTASGSAAVSRYYSYDTGGNIVSEYMLDTENQIPDIRVKYIRDNSGKAISMLQYPQTQDPSSQPQTYYFVYNAHGDVTALTDSTGTTVATYSYDEFGNQTSTDNSGIYNPLRYSGANNAYYDAETGLYKMGVRYYQSDIGRWLTRDDYYGEKQDPQTKNKYVYVENNPLVSADPSGRFSKSVNKAIYNSIPGDIILTKYYGLNYGTGGIVTYWTHASMRIQNGNRYYNGSKYVRGKRKARVAESNNKGKTSSDGSNIWALGPEFDKRKYDVIGIFRAKSTTYTGKAISTMRSYAQQKIPFHWNSDYRSFDDGANCAEIIYRAWKSASGGKVNANDSVFYWGTTRVLLPDTFEDSNSFKQIGGKIFR